jgi:hypothetical protein
MRKQEIAFWCFLSVLCGLTVLEWFVVPERYAIRKELIAPVGATIFSAGLLIIFLGPVRDERGSNWTRWTYWATVLTTSAAVMLIGYLVKPSTPRAVAGVVALGFIPFVWISGFFRQVDRAETELRDLKFNKSYDGTSAPSTTSTKAADHSSNRR